MITCPECQNTDIAFNANPGSMVKATCKECDHKFIVSWIDYQKQIDTETEA